MASEVFFNRVPYTQRRIPPSQLQHDPFASNQASTATTHFQRSVGTIRSGGALTFPPLYLDPVDPAQDPANNQHHAGNPAAQPPGSFVLGSTFYHHPELNALVSNHLVDASANALDAASGTGHAFLSSIFANRDGAYDDDEDADEAAGINATDTSSAVPRPKLTSEFVSLNEDLVPASLDMHGDMLPADQHPSYPFGNLFGPLAGTIAADSAIVGGGHGASASAGASLGAGLGDAAATLGFDFGGGLDGFVNLGQSSHGRRSAISNAWNNFINKASRSKLVGSAAAFAEWNADAIQNSTASANPSSQAETIRAAKKLDLSPSLLFRTNTSTVLAPPTWPFRRHGPGSTTYAALLRPSSNIFGSSPASQAVAATLGGLPASSKILQEIWSDLALEELVPLHIGETSAVRQLRNEQNHQLESDSQDSQSGSGSGRDKKKRKRSDPESDHLFSKRIASIEADPLDLLGPISREIRGQGAQPWGTHTTTGQPTPRRRRRHRSTYSNQSEDEAVEAEHDDVECGFAQRDRVRYSFGLPPASFTWTEPAHEGHDDVQAEGEPARRLHVAPDGIGWSTAKRIFVNEERDRLLPQVASRATGANGAIEAYQVRGIRANQGMLPRPTWSWTDGPLSGLDTQNGDDTSFNTEISGSTSHQSDLHAIGQENVADSEGEEAHVERDWEQQQGEEEEEEEDDAELQMALLMQYQMSADSEAERESYQQGLLYEDDGVEVEEEDEDEEQRAREVGYDDEASEAEEEEVDSFGESETTA
ncbi:uncharacterized protein UTRI_04392_B [Ustilago trichophora]|uniref:Uncharacterized protein n=1 Tax=Ustilago trichophora TaxID=86804 RepID=A0A5C3ED87_9BASI|nr:uncharacterized protein UTRI_04392_B [Ustilago trichophora]